MTAAQAAQQWSSSAPGWGMRLANVMERVDPRQQRADVEVELPKVEERPMSFASKNMFEALVEVETKPVEEMAAAPIPEENWTRPNRRWNKSSAVK